MTVTMRLCAAVKLCLATFLWVAGFSASGDVVVAEPEGPGPFVVVLGIAQDGGVPQTGEKDEARWEEPSMTRQVACLAVVGGELRRRWLIDCTPDFKTQLHRLDVIAPVDDRPGLAGIFLTHGHMGHYTGLVHLGHEAIGAHRVPVFGTKRMIDYLAHNGPWDQLIRYENVALHELEAGAKVDLLTSLSIEALWVPHRQEYTDVVGFLIEGPRRSVLYVPDIDSWEEWDELGVRVEELIARVDVAYLDGTFFADGEIPGRDMSTFPHPFIRYSMDRFQNLPPRERAKIRFIHLNHTNPALWPGSEARREIERRGFRVAEELERVDL